MIGRQTALYKTAAGLVCMGVVAGGVLLLLKQRSLERQFISSLQLVQKESTQPQAAPIVERVVSQAQLWRPIQEQVKDTVVQIFSNIAELDLLQPYKAPTQGTSTGTGFFINEQGEIITNAHVVDEAKSVWVQIPSLGKSILDVDVISVNPEKDLALLQLRQEGLAQVRQELGSVPYVALGDSDTIRRSDEVLALGYPLGQQSLKSTTGIVSGRERHFIQTSAPLNPGNSGGPLLNTQGQVVGVNSAIIAGAQNVGYAIPINDLKIILKDMHDTKLIRKPFLGIIFTNATTTLVEYLGNPKPGGCYVVEVIKNSTLEQAGVKPGDMIYEIDGHKIDIFGEMVVPWGEDKISLSDYIGRLSIGNNISMVIYRHGVRKTISVTFKYAQLPAIHKIYPGYEDLDYEIFGGMIVVPLTLNHVYLLGKNAPGLAKYLEVKHQTEPALLVSHIFPNSQLYRSRALAIGSVIKEVNGMKVQTLDDFRKAVTKPHNNEFLTLGISDTVSNASDNVLIALEWKKVLEEEPKLSRDFRYPLTSMTQGILHIARNDKASNSVVTS